jgi:hypothetical protein
MPRFMRQNINFLYGYGHKNSQYFVNIQASLAATSLQDRRRGQQNGGPIMKFRIRTPTLQSYSTSRKPREPEPTAIAVLQDRLFLPRCSVLQDWFVLRKTRGERGLTS